MHIVIAPNAFKNSLDATEAAKCIEKGLQESLCNCTCSIFPVADGGDGTADLIIRSMNGREQDGIFHDPRGGKVTASLGLIQNDSIAVIEMAAASGLKLLGKDELDPMSASSAGTGEMIVAALDAGVKKIIVTLGGSATVDGGCGILHALGVRFLDDRQMELPPVPKDLLRMHSIDNSRIDPRIAHTEFELWCDVKNTLLGDEGAAAVFGPQKGASPQQVTELDRMLSNLNAMARKLTGVDAADIVSGGAAGGTAAMLHVFLHAKIVSGIEQFLNLTGFEKAIENASLVITGEGQIDFQTLQGKGPYGVAMAAARKNIRVIAIAGKVPIEHYNALGKVFPVLLSLAHRPLSLEESILLTGANLIRVSRQIGNLLSFNV